MRTYKQLAGKGTPDAQRSVTRDGNIMQLNSVSCASPGNCAAVGSYTDNFGSSRAFAVSERGGIWGYAKDTYRRSAHLGVMRRSGRLQRRRQGQHCSGHRR
jgi:hypothetical protein